MDVVITGSLTVTSIAQFLVTAWKGGKHFGFYIYHGHLYRRSLSELKPDVSLDQGFDESSSECYLEVKMQLHHWGYVLDGE